MLPGSGLGVVFAGNHDPSLLIREKEKRVRVCHIIIYVRINWPSLRLTVCIDKEKKKTQLSPLLVLHRHSHRSGKHTHKETKTEKKKKKKKKKNRGGRLL